ncbi:MAG: hypothetical protein HQL15_01575 [Candidatus Omnitrophica bacterium]|nr:hypothetical protein [Candidatus Omnitrophota bacterium]
MIGNSEKCLDPWAGFLIIFVVCIVILLGIFWEFREGGSSKHHKTHMKRAVTVQAPPEANTAVNVQGANGATEPNPVSTF